MARIFFVIVCMTTVLFNLNLCSAEELKFIDANDDTGYYVDMDSVKIQNTESFSVDFIVIKADVNEMEITDLEINHARKVYIIKSVRTLSYSDRTEISVDNQRRLPRSYSDKSLMNEIVIIILNGGE